MNQVNRFLNWAADKVQTATGESARRELVQKLKDIEHDYNETVDAHVVALNLLIRDFNRLIHKLNKTRKGVVEDNINKLSDFLNKFGKVKSAHEYIPEAEKLPASFPEQQFEEIKNYVSNVDWSKDDVFVNTFFRSPLGMKFKTRKQNLSMMEYMGEFQLKAEETVNQLKLRSFAVEQDKKICDLYIECVEFISGFIETRILSELELVESFFQALKIKNDIIVNRPLYALEFHNDIQMLQETIYQKHYMFIKNTFMFYIISCEVYHTPVLTRLLNGQTEPKDVELLDMHKKVLLQQAEQIRDNLMIAG